MSNNRTLLDVKCVFFVSYKLELSPFDYSIYSIDKVFIILLVVDGQYLVTEPLTVCPNRLLSTIVTKDPTDRYSMDPVPRGEGRPPCRDECVECRSRFSTDVERISC